MKITVIKGSPRSKGTTSAIADLVAQKISSDCDVVEIYELNNLTFRDCQGCYACKRNTELCVLEDDATKVLQSIFDSHIVVIASPVYMSDLNGLTKSMLDRFFAFYTANFLRHPKPSKFKATKKLIFIISQGIPDINEFNDIIPRYEKMLSRLGFTFYPIRTVGNGMLNRVSRDKELLLLIDETVEKVLIEPEKTM
jgi:multimeric flavodoxin WrbA